MGIHGVSMTITVGVFALQGAFLEHLVLLKRAAQYLQSQGITESFEFTEVRNVDQLAQCDALIIPGGESTTISLVAAQSGLDVRVNRNHFGRQVESFQADIDLPFLKSDESVSDDPFPGVFIRAPVVERFLPHVEGIQLGEQQVAQTVVAPAKSAKDNQARGAMSSHVDIMGILPGRLKKAAAMGAAVDAGEEVGDIIAVRQGNVFGTSFHPELTSDIRIHVWWLKQVLGAIDKRAASSS